MRHQLQIVLKAHGQKASAVPWVPKRRIADQYALQNLPHQALRV